MSEFRGTPGPWRLVKGTAGYDRFVLGPGEDEGVADVLKVEDAIAIAVLPDILIALDACETALSPVMASHECGDKPEGKDRCGECLGCMNWAAWLLARSTLSAALGEQP